MYLHSKMSDLDIKIAILGLMSWCAVLLIGAVYCIYKAMA